MQKLIISVLLLLTACQAARSASVETPTVPINTAESPVDSISNADATLQSLEKLDAYPFYVMHYFGEYKYPVTSSALPEGREFACSLFAAFGNPSAMLYGRNFDWEYSPSLLLFTDPPDGYASASMVDLTFLGIDPASAGSLTDLSSASDQAALLTAPALPFDGMNEYGLTIAMAALPQEFADDTPYDPSKPNIGSIGVMRQVLDHARNVDEAAAIFTQFNIEFSGGPPIHYLIADRSGKAVLIEFYQDEIVFIPNQSPWHLATNHLRCTAQGNGGCPRYQVMSEQLTASNGQLDTPSAMQLLSEVKQDITQWSSVYNMTSGAITIAIGSDYEKQYTFHLALINP